MSELPDDLQSLLALARDAHDPPDPQARTRVRHAVAASLALSAGVGGALAPGAASAAQSGLASSVASKVGLGTALKTSKVGWTLFGSKLGAVTASTLATAGVGLTLYATQGRAPVQPPRESAPLSAPAGSAGTAAPRVARPTAPVAPAVTIEPAGPPDVPAASSEPPVSPPVALKPAVARTAALQAPSAQRSDTLVAETALLRSASEALARGDESTALRVLQTHAQQFPLGSLREERDGLRAIAECSRDLAPNAASAQRFARLYPGSLMAARVAKACAGK